MGFMGMGSVVGSDAASDLSARVWTAIVAVMREELVKDHGSWNTPGPVNVALVLEQLTHEGAGDSAVFHDGLTDLAEDTRSVIRDYIKAYESDESGDIEEMAEALEDLGRMNASLGRIIAWGVDEGGES